MDNKVGRPLLLPTMDEVNNSLNDGDDAVAEQQVFWRNTLGNQASEELKECYEKIVFWHKYLYMLPKGKDYIKENNRLINEWLIESQTRECVMYALHVMPVLLLQKP